MTDTKPDALTVKYPYRCRGCLWVFWLSYHDLMRLTNSPAALPCGHTLQELAYAFDLDGGEQVESGESKL